MVKALAIFYEFDHTFRYPAKIASLSLNITSSSRASCINSSLLIEINLCVYTTLFASNIIELVTCNRFLKFIKCILVLSHLGAQ